MICSMQEVILLNDAENVKVKTDSAEEPKEKKNWKEEMLKKFLKNH